MNNVIIKNSDKEIDLADSKVKYSMLEFMFNEINIGYNCIITFL